MTYPLEAYEAAVAEDRLRPDSAQARVAGRLDALARALADYRPADPARGGFFGLFRRKAPEPPKGLYLCGGVGRGKSMLMDLFFAHAPVTAKRRVHFHDFMAEVHEAVGDWRDAPARERRRRLKDLGLDGTGDDPAAPVGRAIARSATLLCFDELQVSDIADAMILGRLFERLFADGVVMVATSNRAPGDLYKDGLNRQLFLPFIDMIHRRLDVVHLDSETDYRLARLKGARVYLTPLGPETDGEMDRLWTELTDGAEGSACTLAVKGRQVTVPRQAQGVARMTFEELCARPLGAADYTAVAHDFHTLMIDAIPKLGPEKRNEAKRFVTLIDVLYERKVKLIASAEAPAEALYTEGDGAFEFERTASRLIEMQSADYLDQDHAA